jgi:thymidylate kinase
MNTFHYKDIFIMSRLDDIISNPYNTKAITIIEGPDASGKTTNVNKIREAFEKTDLELRLVRCPDNRGGAKIREVIMSDDLAKNPSALAFLFLADFLFAFESIIKPELDNPKVRFILDRMLPSTAVYQNLDIPYLNKVLSKFEDFTNAFSKAEYLYLVPNDFEAHKKRLSSKTQDEINHLDPVGDDKIRDQIVMYNEFIHKHKLFGLLGNFNVSTIYV